ncbi:MAG: OmpA family protein [Polyangiaceae bacterium]|nr:OmpA family protein [Polyangiaceae bacterium]
MNKQLVFAIICAVTAAQLSCGGLPAYPADGDEDGDGILDYEDACPWEPGVPSEDPRKHGCPQIRDRDGDGISDNDDACPDEPGPANDDPSKHGCPNEPDRDGDGIPDAEDACPDKPGPANSDRRKHGCPPPSDRDGDGIPDAEDACPDEAGPPNSDPRKHGCPKAVVTGSDIVIMERIDFDTNKSTIRPESERTLSEIFRLLQSNPDIAMMRVDAHSDNRGSAALNLRLTQERAASVVHWLTCRGVDPKRLSSAGFGGDRPIDTNSTDQGRANNRRVEFRVVERRPYSGPAPSTQMKPCTTVYAPRGQSGAPPTQPPPPKYPPPPPPKPPTPPPKAPEPVRPPTSDTAGGAL